MASGDSEILRSFIRDILSLPDRKLIDKWRGTDRIFDIVSDNSHVFPMFNIQFKRLASNEIRLSPPEPKQSIWVYIDNQLV